MMNRFGKISPTRTGSPDNVVEMPFTRYRPSGSTTWRRSSNNSEACDSFDRSSSSSSSSYSSSSSSTSSRESGEIYRLAWRLAYMFSQLTRKSSTQALKSSPPPITSTQPNTDTEKNVARDAPRRNADTPQQGTEHAPKDGHEVPGQGAESPSRGPSGVPTVPKRIVKKPRGTDLATVRTSKVEYVKCKYCGQTSGVAAYNERVQTLKRPTKRGVTPTRTLTPVRCKLCYSVFPVSPHVQPRIPCTAQQEKELVDRGVLKILWPKEKLSTLWKTHNMMMEERGLQEEKNENKKRERETSRFVDRDALLMKLHVHRAVLGTGNPGHEVAKNTLKGAVSLDPMQPSVDQK